jgi:hypothetical protein
MALLALTSLIASQAAAQARPVNFRQVGQGRDAGNGVLHFDYAWDSSSGRLADLNNCETGENVAYPGANPYVWTSPPYAANRGTTNPTVLWVPGTDGEAQDNHSHFDFLRPYRADNFTATQDYRWRCSNINNNQITNFANFVGIQIVRTVANTLRNPADNCWFYTITKSGATAQVRPLPNASPCPAIAHGLAKEAKAAEGSAEGAAANVTYTLASSSIGLHEPVFAEFAVQNPLTSPIHFDLGLNRRSNFEVAITQPNGVTVIRRLSSEGFGSSGAMSVAAGESFHTRLLLNRWSDFASPGDYAVKITLLCSVISEDGAIVALAPSQELHLRVEQPDAATLRAIAAELAHTALTAPNIAERMEAAQTLSYINDPVAVPELARVLEQGTFMEQYAIEGLGRIATPQAVAILWNAMSHADPEVRSFARFTLSQVGAQGAPSVKD